MYTKDGKRVEVSLNATTRRDADGNTIGVVGVGQDISDVKSAQAALQQAQKMEVVGQLTGGVAHDFNNLLTVISGNLSYLRDELGVMSADVIEIIDDAQSAARDGAELTHRLLAFARQQILAPKETYVNDLIIDTSRLISRALGEGIKITTALDSENPLVMVDQSQLESALMNLCISDIMMPGGMRGRQLASIVSMEYPEIKIQLTTGHENVDITKNGADVDFPLLRKPYDQKGLATALRELLDLSGENTGFRKPNPPH